MSRRIDFRCFGANADVTSSRDELLKHAFTTLFVELERKLLADGVAASKAETTAAKEAERLVYLLFPEWKGQWGFRIVHIF